jgi:GntR family transcriptional regulator
MFGSELPLMEANWNDGQPIYRQLRDRVVAMILEGALKEGDPLPSVRNVAADFRLNPLTVLKGYQQLVDEQLVEKRRGRGMYVAEGAKRALMKGERQKFLEDEWPRIHATIQRLGLTAGELLAVAPAAGFEPRSSTSGAAPTPSVDGEEGPDEGGDAPDLDASDDKNS